VRHLAARLRAEQNWLNVIWPSLPIIAAVLFTTILLLLFGASPIESFAAMWQGAFGTSDHFFAVMAFWVPLLLAAAGLLITFQAGLWNIGIEGQIIMGAIGASWVASARDPGRHGGRRLVGGHRRAAQNARRRA
jgi:simple sugar transport system permease protein